MRDKAWRLFQQQKVREKRKKLYKIWCSGSSFHDVDENYGYTNPDDHLFYSCLKKIDFTYEEEYYNINKYDRAKSLKEMEFEVGKAYSENYIF